MKTYQIIGLNSPKQAERIQDRFYNAMGHTSNIAIDFEHSTIQLPEDIDSYTVSLISSFEQVSIVPREVVENYHIHEKDDHDHHHHEHAVAEGKNAQRNMLIVFSLNLIFSIGEFIFGTLFKSQALLSDAVHDLGDALSIGLAYFFEKISNRGVSSQYSYGYRRFSLLGALVTSVILIVGATLVIVNSIPVLFNPQPLNHQGVFWVAVGAILVNGFSAWLISRGESANEKLLNIHLFEDLFGWIVVLAMSILLNYKDWYILDPIFSMAIAGWILYVTIPEFLRISKFFLQAVPETIDADKLRESIQQLDGVNAISHFHIWSTDGQQHMMSLTITTTSESKQIQEGIKQEIRKIVLEHNISHITIEVLYDPDKLIEESISCAP